MTSIVSRYNPRHPKHQRGLSLVELMVSMVISLALLAGLTTLLVQQSQTRGELEKSSRQIENGRYAMSLLHDDIQHAGFYGQYFILPAAPGALPDPCSTTTASLTAAMPLAIQGYDSPAASPLSCINNANFLPNTDILVIRRAGTASIGFDPASPLETISVLAAGQVYLQTNTSSIVMGVGAGAKGDTTAYPLVYDPPPNGSGDIHAPLRQFLVNIYFISPCSTMANGLTCTATDDDGRPVPTLKRLELTQVGGATQFVLTPLVEGIENMQLDYGLDTDIDGYPDNYTNAPSSAADWSNTMTVSVNLLARNNDPSADFSDSKTYNLGMATTVGPFSEDTASQRSPVCKNAAGVAGTGAYPQRCNYKRHIFSGLVLAVNPSGRRAAQ